MSAPVLDASVVLAVLHNETGADTALPYMPGGLISAVNMAEVWTKLLEREVPTSEIADLLAAMGIQVCGFAEADAMEAAALRTATRERGLSLGDRACLALGRLRRATVITADRAWAGLNLGIEIVIVR